MAISACQVAECSAEQSTVNAKKLDTRNKTRLGKIAVHYIVDLAGLSNLRPK